jgi:hypothetical protein
MRVAGLVVVLACAPLTALGQDAPSSAPAPTSSVAPEVVGKPASQPVGKPASQPVGKPASQPTHIDEHHGGDAVPFDENGVPQTPLRHKRHALPGVAEDGGPTRTAILAFLVFTIFTAIFAAWRIRRDG